MASGLKRSDRSRTGSAGHTPNGKPGLNMIKSPPAMKLNRFAQFAWLVLSFNLGVILWGAYVRASSSGAGCGSHWPLCNGEAIPQAPTIKTLIEFSHRLTSGIALILVVALLVWALRAFARRHQVRTGAWLSLFFIFTEALIGAGLVLLQRSDE